MNIKVIISGGGTGGHIFPAIAIANAIKAQCPVAEILFVGAKGRMEMEKVPAAGYRIEGLTISGFQRSFTIKNLWVPVKIILSMIKAAEIISKFKPDVVVGVGGYASGPMLQTALRKKIPTLIQEQNSYPGITNKILSKRVNKICVAYPGMEKFFPTGKILFTGNPVRQDISRLTEKKKDALEYFKLSASKKTLLVIGGSLGARTINESIAGGLKQLGEKNIQLVWQTGKGYFETALKFTQQSEPISGGMALSGNLGWVGGFISRMDYAYAAADLVVSRAGALSVSELCVAAKASIFIPSPNVAEDHQTKNALSLVNNNAALLVKDSDSREMLVKKIIELANDEMLINSLEKNISRLAKTNAASEIASEIIQMARKVI